ncbi:unnamed protein product [Rotaria sp. Silwood1]|nr:unnamed protein product [Rotaria sp. Silwood1]
MFSTRKKTSRLNKRLAHLRRRHSDLHAIIDIFNYSGAHVSTTASSSSLFTTNDIPSLSSSLLPSTSQDPLNVSPHESCCSSSSTSPSLSSSSSSSSSASSSSSLSSLSDFDNLDNDPYCSINNKIFNSNNIEGSKDTFIKFFTDYDLQNPSEPLTSKEIAVLLIELRNRHSLTKTCITHFCRLLQLLKVPNAPPSFDSIESLILSAYQSTTFPTQSIICPSCHQRSSSTKRCTSTHDCALNHSFICLPTIKYTFALEPQLRAILERNQIVFSKFNDGSISDITDGQFYKKLLRKESEPFITLLMNSDGGLVKAISTSIWCTTFVVNELPRVIRFLPENTIIGMISTGATKPKKDAMSSIMEDLVKELHRLEEGISVLLTSDDSNNLEQLIRIFLIGCVCDKPATSLVLNHVECTGFFGCIYCTMREVRNTTIRSFVYDPNEKVILRSNKTYDDAIEFINNDYKLTNSTKISKAAAKEYLQGVKGPCLLRQLKYFNIYTSFLCDTLHNLYLGVMGKMLKLFLSKRSIIEGISAAMSIHKQIDNLAEIVNSISYPSTTYRQPRDIHLFKKFKANELRMILLFGYSAFENFLDQERFIHLKVLAFIAHLVEEQNLSENSHQDIKYLARYFNEKFASLYTVSSFARTIHGGFAPLRELIKNIDLCRQSSIHVSSTSFSTIAKEYVSGIFSSRQIIFKHEDALPNIKLHQKITPPPSNFFQKFPNSSSSNVLFYKTLFLDRLRFSADDFTVPRHSNDACILYQTKKNYNSIGFILFIIHFIDKNEIYLFLNKVKLISTADTVDIQGRNFRCNNILKGVVVPDSTTIIQPSQILQKLAFRPISNDDPTASKAFVFCRYPNLRECS